MMPRPRIAVVAGYMPFFDEIMPPGYAADREAFGRTAADAVAGTGEVTYLGLVRDHETGASAGRQLAALRPDAVLVVPTMATPAGYLWAVLEPNPDIPVVLWAAHEESEVAASYDMPVLCRHSSNVGALMIGNMLSRHGRRFATVVGPRDEDAIGAEVRDAVKVAVLAGQLRRARIGRLGEPLDGYLNVDIDPAALRRATGSEIVDVPLEEWQDAIATTSDENARSVLASLPKGVDLDDRGRPHDVLAAARLASALAVIADRHRLDAGTLNCRGAFGVANSEIATLGCLAVTHVTSRGVPFTCTGDLPTALAMLAGRRLGGAALYCELDAIDQRRDAFLCANTGEGDFGWRGGTETCKVFASGSDSGRHAGGCSVRHGLKRGPATVIGFTPKADATGGFTFLAMEGETLDPPDVALTVTSAWFRAEMRPMRRAFAAWVDAGATHHASLTPGRHGDSLARLAAALGIGFASI